MPLSIGLLGFYKRSHKAVKKNNPFAAYRAKFTFLRILAILGTVFLDGRELR